MGRPSFAQACARYIHRFTMEHVPAWAARRPCDDGGDATWYYAPQFLSDREWYDNTVFPSEPEHSAISKRDTSCYTTGQTWPLGQHLAARYTKQRAAA